MTTPRTRDERTDGGDDQREDEALLAERRLAEDERGDERHGVGLEQVGRHAGAVADVVADVVGDGGRVARVVLGDALLDLADEVGADVGRLGEDAAADAHEHGEQRGAEAEALEHRGRVTLVDQDDRRGTEQAETDDAHADEAAGAERDPRALGAAALPADAAAATRTFARVASHMPRYPIVAENTAPTRKNDRAAELDAVVTGQQEQEREDDDGEDRQGAELAAQVRRRPFLHGLGDVLHLLGAFARGEHLPTKYDSDDQRHDGDGRDDRDDREARGPELDHASSSTPRGPPGPRPDSQPRCCVTGRV